MNDTSFSKIIKKEKLMLPPLAGFTDYPFRCILSMFDPPFVCTEMVNAKAVINQNEKTMEMIQKEPGNHLKGVQLIGNNPDNMQEAAIILEKNGFDYIDINMGCTVKKVISKGQGAALMKQEDLAVRIVEQICSIISIPVTVKMRSGFSENNKNAVSLARKLEKAGVSAITVHGRSGERKFGIHVDYDIIKKVSYSVDIPVIANGGVSKTNACEILKKTNAFGVMPGRNLIGDPWIFPQIKKTLSYEAFQYPSLNEKKSIIQKHLRFQCDFYGERNGVSRFRTILPKYFRYCHNLNALKDDVRVMCSYFDVLNILDRIIIDDEMCAYQ